MKPALIFDGDCAFCTNTANLVRRLDKRRELDVQAWQRSKIVGQVGLTPQECQRAVQFVDETGRVFAGAAAANQTLRRLGGVWRAISIAYTIPGLRQLEDALYAWVARNRYRLPGGTPECQIKNDS